MSSDSVSRRLFCAHAVAVLAGPTFGHDDPSPLRIRHVRLKTGQTLAQMRAFYADTLGLPVEAATDDAITLRTGTGRLTFEHSPGVAAKHHFAFNIPSDAIVAAHDWITARAERIKPPARLRDANLPDHIVSFRHWNAHAVFFWDPAGNAVEFIARHDLPVSRPSPKTFGPELVQCISEIGLVVDDVPAAAAHVTKSVSAPTYIGARPSFAPIGSPHGLLLMMQTGVRMAFGRGEPRSAFPTTVELAQSLSSPVTPPGSSHRIVGSAPAAAPQ